MKKKGKQRSSSIYSEVQLTGIKHSNMIHRLATVERLLQQYIRIEWPATIHVAATGWEKRDDHEALFLTRISKPNSRTASLLLHRASLKKRPWNLLLMISDTYTTGAQPPNPKGCPWRASVESAQLERFRHIMKWRSPETMNIPIKTMIKRQAMKAVLDDEGVQEQNTTNAQAVYSKWIETLLQEIRRLKPHPHETMSSIDVRIEKV